MIWHATKMLTVWWKKPRIRKGPPSLPPQTYEQRLSQSVDQIREDFDVDQAVLNTMTERLDEDEAKEFSDVPRQKMLRRIYKALGGEELE